MTLEDFENLDSKQQRELIKEYDYRVDYENLVDTWAEFISPLDKNNPAVDLD